jgi:hypothetical protein
VAFVRIKFSFNLFFLSPSMPWAFFSCFLNRFFEEKLRCSTGLFIKQTKKLVESAVKRGDVAAAPLDATLEK